MGDMEIGMLLAAVRVVLARRGANTSEDYNMLQQAAEACGEIILDAPRKPALGKKNQDSIVLTDELKAQIAELYNGGNGMTPAEISEKLGIKNGQQVSGIIGAMRLKQGAALIAVCYSRFFHTVACASIRTTPKKDLVYGTRGGHVGSGRKPCGHCKP